MTAHLHLCVLVLLALPLTRSQYSEESQQYKRIYDGNIKALEDEVMAHPDLADVKPPSTQRTADSYSFFNPQHFRVGLLIDPCRGNPADCCMNSYGSPEYPSLITSRLEAERYYKPRVIANEGEIATNYVYIDEDNNVQDSSTSRMNDDDTYIDYSCSSSRVPFSYCEGRNYARSEAANKPPCIDNNRTLNALANCIDPVTSKNMSHCFQVAYTATSFFVTCNEGYNASGVRCGTYLEIHMAKGSPYNSEYDIISQTKLTTRDVDGYFTTTISSQWMGDESKVLCSYSESKIRVGSLVYVKAGAPTCCCPKPFSSDLRYDGTTGTFQGSQMCPKGANGNGPFAADYQSLADELFSETVMQDYPPCDIDVKGDADSLVCSQFSLSPDRRDYVRECQTITEDPNEKRARKWFSDDLQGKYYGKCKYFDSCGITYSSEVPLCSGLDTELTFAGRVGIVVSKNDLLAIPTARVTFNNYRTDYEFDQESLKLETLTQTMYEVWVVTVTPHGSRVLKRKPFKVSEPACTFDNSFDKYLPYAKLNEKGAPLDTSDEV